jgi:aspartyl-tRNA(Asn)/glutamyl-tRNA(Gln) amidotransferase subunit A
MTDLTSLPIAQAADLLRGRSLSPVELAQAHLDRIAAQDADLHCFITVTAELALEQARTVEREIAAGEWRGPLHGIPLALKDLYDTAGVRTTAGAAFFRERVPDMDAMTVQRLRAAGAVLLGKLNMHEWALGLTNENPHYGVVHNPWDGARVAGGSSGGSAAALAAGMCMGSLGSDTGGSIRVPAALCGVVGIKPTYGRVSARGVVPLSWNLDHCGPLARTVHDCALLLQTIAGYDAGDPASVNRSVDDYARDLDAGVAGLRLALLDGEYLATTDAPVMAAVERAAGILEQLGARIERIELPGFAEAALANGRMVTADAAAFHHERLRDAPERYGADVLARMQAGAAVTSSEYVLARRTQAEWRRDLERQFERYDALLLPTTPIPAPLIGGDQVQAARTLTRFTSAFNLAGLPALSVPCGFTPERLPIGLQIVCAAWQEALALRIGQAYASAVTSSETQP